MFQSPGTDSDYDLLFSDSSRPDVLETDSKLLQIMFSGGYQSVWKPKFLKSPASKDDYKLLFGGSYQLGVPETDLKQLQILISRGYESFWKPKIVNSPASNDYYKLIFADLSQPGFLETDPKLLHFRDSIEYCAISVSPRWDSIDVPRMIGVFSPPEGKDANAWQPDPNSGIPWLKELFYSFLRKPLQGLLNETGAYRYDNSGISISNPRKWHFPSGSEGR